MNVFDTFVACILDQLTPDERAAGVAYAATIGLASRGRCELPGIVIEVPSASHLAFIDRQPMANWGHAARYVLYDDASGNTSSIEARLPPFAASTYPQWRVIHKGATVPDALVPDPGATDLDPL